MSIFENTNWNILSIETAVNTDFYKTIFNNKVFLHSIFNLCYKEITQSFKTYTERSWLWRKAVSHVIYWQSNFPEKRCLQMSY